MRAVGEILREAVAIVLVAAAILKVRAPGSVSRSLEAAGFERASTRLGMAAAWSIATVELAVAVITGLGTGRGSLIPAAILMTGFAIFLFRIHARSPGAPCACLGSASTTGEGASAARLALMLLALTGAAIAPHSRLSWAAVTGGAELALLLVLVTDSVPVILRFRRTYANRVTVRR